MATAALRFEEQGDGPADAGLPPALQRAAPRRRREFLAGRQAARRAVVALDPGAAASPIGVGQGRQPLWPPGLVGSITHAGGFALAAVARRSDIAGIGVDSEPLIGAAVGREIVGLVGAVEQSTLLGRGGDDRLILTAIFSAKESLFKCLYPLIGLFFEPADAEVVTLSLAAGLFTIRLGRTLSPAFPAGWSAEGRLAVDQARVHTGIALVTA